ncbi:hypothetical protein C8R47DRAFT_1200020 [Mycena vitilis]|nr:hypothetical protein C8R47DRAFT_1200020 [Mycena vitilis]
MKIGSSMKLSEYKQYTYSGQIERTDVGRWHVKNDAPRLRQHRAILGLYNANRKAAHLSSPALPGDLVNLLVSDMPQIEALFVRILAIPAWTQMESVSQFHTPVNHRPVNPRMKATKGRRFVVDFCESKTRVQSWWAEAQRSKTGTHRGPPNARKGNSGGLGLARRSCFHSDFHRSEPLLGGNCVYIILNGVWNLSSIELRLNRRSTLDSTLILGRRSIGHVASAVAKQEHVPTRCKWVSTASYLHRNIFRLAPMSSPTHPHAGKRRQYAPGESQVYYGSPEGQSSLLIHADPERPSNAPTLLGPQHPSDADSAHLYQTPTLTAIPKSEPLLHDSKLSLGLIISPHRTLADGENAVPVVEDGIISRCQSWRCALCGLPNDVPHLFEWNSIVQQPKDRYARVELNYAVVDFAAGPEYVRGAPLAPTFVFLLDAVLPIMFREMISEQRSDHYKIPDDGKPRRKVFAAVMRPDCAI